MSFLFLKQYRFHILIVLALVLVGFVVSKQSESKPQSTAVPAAVSLNRQEINSERERVVGDIGEYGAEAAYKIFKDRHADRDRVTQHDLAHIFGEALYTEVGNPGVAVCDASFSYGCYHSFFGYALMENGLDIIFDLEAACIETHGEKGLGCQHGIGHGILAEVGYDKLQEALDACSELQWKGPIGGCTSGVFMEYNFATMQNGPTRTLKEENTYSPCDSISEEFHEACHFELPQWWFAWYNMEALEDGSPLSYERAGEHCEGVADPTNRAACYRGLGNIIAGRLEYSIDGIKERCQMETSEGTSQCLQGAAWLLSWEPKYSDNWEELCGDEEGDALRICLASKDLI